jgi:hypothetical protein
MPEQIGHRLNMHARFEPRDSSGVPQRVHANVGDASRFRRDLEHPQEIARIDRAAKLGREHQPRVLPLIRRSQPIGFLRGAMLPQHRDNSGGDWHRAP